MSNVTEISQWVNGIYQLEITDPVEGGAGGISNLQAQQLGDRTKYLYDNKISFLKKGTATVGDIPASSSKQITVSFSDVGTNNYMVNGSLVSKSTDYTKDTAVIWVVKDKTSTSFKLCLRELVGEVQNLDFDYILIPF